jgi:phospholipid/cholesterol/gamma-HCH transport system substrate-binding protein
MQSNRALELGTGLFVALGFAALFFLTTQLPASGLRWGSDSGYQLTAKFENVGDLKEGSPVSMAGVNIGRVASIGFDPVDFRAVVTMRIDPRFDKIPDDSDASIQTQGLLGGKFVGIGPGGSETFLGDGGRIEFTQSAIVLESLINKFFANFASRGRDGEGTDRASGPAAAPPADGK